MPRYIDADKLIAKMKEIEVDGLLYKQPWWEIYDNLVKAIKEAPTADVEEVKHGQWRVITTPFLNTKTIICPECSYTELRGADWDISIETHMRCPRCGMKMDGARYENGWGV